MNGKSRAVKGYGSWSTLHCLRPSTGGTAVSHLPAVFRAPAADTDSTAASITECLLLVDMVDCNHVFLVWAHGTSCTRDRYCTAVLGM